MCQTDKQFAERSGADSVIDENDTSRQVPLPPKYSKAARCHL